MDSKKKTRLITWYHRKYDTFYVSIDLHLQQKKTNLCEKACESKCFLRTWLTAIADAKSYDVKPKPKYTSHSYELLATILIGDLRISWLNTKMRNTWKKIDWRTSWSLRNTQTIKRIIYITISASSAFDKEYGHGFFIHSDLIFFIHSDLITWQTALKKTTNEKRDEFVLLNKNNK